MARTSSAAVILVLGQRTAAGKAGNYDGQSDLSPYIEAASSVVDDLAAAASAEGITFTSTKAELVERWLAAHYYTQMDPLYKSRTTDRGKGDFVEQNFLMVATQLDPTGLLPGILEGNRAEGDWLGKAAPDALTYEERN